jgi:hypothetical protein
MKNNDLLFLDLLLEAYFKIYHLKLDETNFISKQPYLFSRISRKPFFLDTYLIEIINYKYDFVNDFINLTKSN